MNLDWAVERNSFRSWSVANGEKGKSCLSAVLCVLGKLSSMPRTAEPLWVASAITFSIAAIKPVNLRPMILKDHLAPHLQADGHLRRRHAERPGNDHELLTRSQEEVPRGLLDAASQQFANRWLQRQDFRRALRVIARCAWTCGQFGTMRAVKKLRPSPQTMAWSMQGSLSNNPSTSAGAIFLPLDRTMISFFRPVIVKNPGRQAGPDRPCATSRRGWREPWPRDSSSSPS